MKKIVACIIGFASVIAVNLNGLDFNMNFGDLFVLLSGVSLGISSVLIKRYSDRADPVVISGYQFILGGAVMALVGLAFGGRIDAFNLAGAFILLYLAALSAVAYALWGVLLKHNPVSRVTVFSFMIPVFGVILTKIMLPDESDVHIISLIVSLLLVALGVFLLNYVRPSKGAPVTEAAFESPSVENESTPTDTNSTHTVNDSTPTDNDSTRTVNDCTHR